MFKPHYWYHGNRAMPSEKLNDIFSFVNKTDVRKLLDDEKNHLTTYFAEDESLSVFFKNCLSVGTSLFSNCFSSWVFESFVLESFSSSRKWR